VGVEPHHHRWDYAVLRVANIPGARPMTFLAVAYVGDHEIYRETVSPDNTASPVIWARPLADLELSVAD
jgi:hypothetical protein